MLGDVLTRFSTAIADGTPSGYVVTRRAPASFTAQGLIVSGATSTVTIDACVQTFNGREIKVLPEGVHAEDVRVIDALVPLVANPPDHIAIAGDDFAMFRVDGPNNFPDGTTRYTGYACRQAVPG